MLRKKEEKGMGKFDFPKELYRLIQYCQSKYSQSATPKRAHILLSQILIYFGNKWILLILFEECN